MLDLASQDGTLSLEELETVHRAKTGALMTAAVVIGGLAARAPERAVASLRAYGEAIGLAFQIADDVLDATSTTTALGSELSRAGAKPVRWLGRRGLGAPWQLVESANPGPWHELAACLLLANRAGSVSRTDVESFQSLVSDVAAALGAPHTRIDAAVEADRAEALDRFCADLDVQIGLTILKSELGQIAGTRLRGVAEAAGFRINATGHFEYSQEETGAPLYLLQNYKQEPFSPESLRRMTTPGVVFVLDVPRVADPVRVFDQMRMAAKRMTQTLEGVLVDDNRRPLTDTSLAAIRAQVQVTAAALREANIDPGGTRALRLFG